MVPDNYSESMARGLRQQSDERRRAGVSLDGAVVDAADEDTLLGSVGIVSLDWRHLRAELGYWTAPPGRAATGSRYGACACSLAGHSRPSKWRVSS